MFLHNRDLFLPSILAAGLVFAAPAARAEMHLSFTPDPIRARVSSVAGACEVEPGLARGLLTGSTEGSWCRIGLVGSVSDPAGVSFFAGQAPTETVAVFETRPLTRPLSLTGSATLVVYTAAATSAGGLPGVVTGLLHFTLREKHASGYFDDISTGDTYNSQSALGNSRIQTTFEMPAYTLQPGSKLQVLLSAGAPDTHIYFGGNAYHDTGITLGTFGADRAPGTLDDIVDYVTPEPERGGDTIEDPVGSDKAGAAPIASAGALPATFLMPLALLALARRRRRLGAAVTIAAVALGANVSSAQAATFLAFTPDPSRDAGSAATQGDCLPEPGVAIGKLTATAAGSTCHFGGWGTTSGRAFAGDETVEQPATASFSTNALTGELHLSGTATISFAHRTEGTYSGVPATYQAPRFSYQLVDIDSIGTETTIVGGTGALATSTQAVVKHSAAQFAVPEYTVAPGHRLRVRLTSEDSPDTQIYFGGEYSDSGVSLESDDAGGGGMLGAIGAGALSPLSLLGLLAGITARRWGRKAPSP